MSTIERIFSQTTPPKPTMKRIVVRGENLLAKVRELIHQGNVRRIIIISEKGDSILEIPLTAGVIGAIVAPVLVAIGAIAALANNYTLLIEATRQSRQPATSPATSSRTAPNGRRSRGNRGDEPAVAGR